MSALTDTTDTSHRHVIEASGGGQIRFYVCHGRVEITTQSANGRHRNTTPRSVEEMRETIRRLEDLCFLAEQGAHTSEPQVQVVGHALTSDGIQRPNGFGISVRQAPEEHVCLTIHNPSGQGGRWHFFLPNPGGRHLGRLLIEQADNADIADGLLMPRVGEGG